MYFDTLKATSIEQSASETSARGGLHNPEQIIWKFNKEITVKLTDALYTPASLSLLWGGRFGIQEAEINGFWNPIQYNINENVEIQEYISQNNEDIKELLQKFKKPIQLYQEYLNIVYELIQTQNNFLKLYWDIYFENDLHIKVTPNEIYDEIDSYIPVNDVERERIINYAKEQLGIESESSEPTDIILSLNVTLDDGETLQSYQDYFNSLYNTYNIFFNQHKTENPQDKTDIDILTDDQVNEEYNRLLDYGKSDFYYLIEFFLNFNSKVKKKLINKKAYDFKYLITGCQEVLYGLVSQYTDYDLLAAAQRELPIDYLLNNYMIYQGEKDSVSRIYFLIDDNYDVRGDYSYKYTSQYLGYDKDKIKYDYILNINEEPVKYNCSLFQPVSKKIGQPAEKAKVILRNFEDFNIHTRKKGVTYNDRTLLHEITISTQADKDLFYSAEKDLFYDYEWTNCELQMVSLEGDKDSYYINNVDVLYRINGVTLEKKILIKQHDEDEYTSQINVYSEDQQVGTFYINDSFNFDTQIENSFYPIKQGINEVNVLDKTEKCKADFTFCIDTDKNLDSDIKRNLPKYSKTNITVYYNPKTMKPYQPNSSSYTKQDGTCIYGNLKVFEKGEIFYRWTRTAARELESLGQKINVNAQDFPGNYRLVGHTTTRARIDGEDSYLQLEIPLCSVISNAVLDLSADGEPTTFSMDLKVLADKNGDMIKITKYDASKVDHNGHNIIPEHGQYINTFCEQCDIPEVTFRRESGEYYNLLMPLPNSYYCFDLDCLPPFNGKSSHLILPKTNKLGLEIGALYDKYKEAINLPSETPNKENLVKYWEKQLDQYRDVILIEAATQATYIYIGEEKYKMATYQNHRGESDESLNKTTFIDGKEYCLEYITQENFDTYSPLTFTLKSTKFIDNISEVDGE